MTETESVLTRLPTAKTAADFEALRADAEREHEAAKAALAELAVRREDTIFSGGDLAKLDAEIAAAQRQVETLEVALEGVRKRHLAAVEAEHQAALEAEHKETLKMVAELRQTLADFAAAAGKIADAAGRYRDLRRTIDARNRKARENGRRDLTVKNPLRELSEATGRHVLDPLHGLQVPGFWPRHPDGPVLAELTK